MSIETRDEQIRIAEMCKEKGRGLTKWEENFLESILDQMGNDKYLSDKQASILYKIYEEKASD